MDPASAIALAALAVEATSKLYTIIRDLKEVPANFRQELEWLSRLREILSSIENTSYRLVQLETGVNIRILHQSLGRCYVLVQALKEQVEKTLKKIKERGLNKRVATIGAVFKSEAFQRSKEEISHCMNDLSLCQQELSRYGSNVRSEPDG